MDKFAEWRPVVLEIPPGRWCRFISSVAKNDRRTGFADGISTVDASTTGDQCCDTANYSRPIRDLLKTVGDSFDF